MSIDPPPTPSAPVEMLAYQPPTRIAHPGILTAIGILSIIYGVISGLASLYGMVAGAGLFVLSRQSIPVPAATTNPAAFPATMPTTMPMVQVRFDISPIVSATVVGESALSAALALMMIVAGIMVLANARRGATVHWFFVWVKPPLILICGIASGIALAQFFEAARIFLPPGSRSSPTPSYVLPTIMLSLVAMAYPIALLIVFRTRLVMHTYYSRL